MSALRPAIDRFKEKCVFRPETGCVLWIGGKTSGHGRVNNSIYGAFWFEGRRWFAHRWAAIYIHGLNPGSLTVGHCCPWNPDGHPDPLCVQHLEVSTIAENVAERNVRRAIQTPTQRLYWKLVQLGYEPEPAIHDGWAPDVPHFDPPGWLQ